MKQASLSLKSLALTAVLAALAGSPVAAADIEGMVLPLDEVIVSATAENVIREIAIEEGDAVKKDAMLARLDTRVKALRLERFKKVLAMREESYRSSKNLIQDKIISAEEAMKTEIERDLAEIEVKLAQEELDQLTIKSPLDGIIVEIFKKEGESVRVSQEMFRIINVDQVYLQFFLPDEQLSLLKKEQELKVRFPVLGEQGTFTGRVDFIDPRIDATSGFIRIRVLIDNPKHKIRAGMRGVVSL